MKYATWKIKFDTNQEGQSTPEINIKNDGAYAEGAFYIDFETIAGYIVGDVNFQDFSDWNLNEITKADFLNAAKIKNPLNEFNTDGKLKYFKNETSSL
jgi:hypothetical protein